MNYIQLTGAIEIGLIYSLIGMGIYLTFRLIDFPDLSVDGSLTFGGVLAGILILQGYSPIIASLVAFLGGILAGIITSIVYLKFSRVAILSGILTMSALFTINFRVMGLSNISLLDGKTIFIEGYETISLLLIVLSVVILLWFLLKTNIGLAMRAIGQNKKICDAIGISYSMVVTVALALSNGLVALAGGILAQYQGFVDISMGTGTLIIGLAGIVLGEIIVFSKNPSFVLLGAILGSLLYRVVIVIALNSTNIGLKAIDIYLITALLLLILIGLSKKLNINGKKHVRYN